MRSSFKTNLIVALLLGIAAAPAYATGNSNNSDTNISADADASAVAAASTGPISNTNVAGGGNANSSSGVLNSGNSSSNSSAAVVGSGNSSNSNTNVNAPVALGGQGGDAKAYGGTSNVTNKVDTTDVNVNGQQQGQSLDADLSNKNAVSNINGQGQSVDNTNVGVNDQSQKQGQDQGQSQLGINEQSQNAASDQDQSQSANNEGVEQATDVTLNQTYKQVRQAPSIGQGSIAIAGCAAGGNVGGSNSRGAAFLGIGFTTAECYAFILAQAYDAVGERKSACQVLNTTKAAKRAAKRGLTLPTCEPLLVVDPVTNTFVTKEELAEHEKRIVKAAAKK